MSQITTPSDQITRYAETMILTDDDLHAALTRIGLEGGDCLDLEAKTFHSFSARALGPTLSSLANLPGGGTILLGVDEKSSDPVVGVADPHLLSQQATNLARNGLSTPVTVDVRTLRTEGRDVVVLNVAEAATSSKPVEYQGKAYARQYDGDYSMSLQERQQLLRRHERPREDRQPVAGTSRKDLQADATASFTASVRRSTPALADASDTDILVRLNVLTPDGEATVAGLYALGTYPQQYLPHLSLTAAVTGAPDDRHSVTDRGRNRKDLTGPLPQILDETVEWVAQNVGSTLLVSHDGQAGSHFDIPLVAVREVVANALVHRDLSDATAGRVVELRLTPSGLVLTSPGGLWGLSVDQLGTPDGKSAVNEFLYGICRHLSGRSGRVIEAMGTGIYATRAALKEAGLEPPRFIDNGLRFTVRFPNHSLHDAADLTWLASLPTTGLSQDQKTALLQMHHGAVLANADYRRLTGRDSEESRADLQELVARGLVVRTGQRRGTRYQLARG